MFKLKLSLGRFPLSLRENILFSYFFPSYRGHPLSLAYSHILHLQSQQWQMESFFRLTPFINNISLPPSCKDACDYIGSTWMIQENLLNSGFLPSLYLLNAHYHVRYISTGCRDKYVDVFEGPFYSLLQFLFHLFSPFKTRSSFQCIV